MKDIQLFSIITNKDNYSFMIEPDNNQYLIILKTNNLPQFTGSSQHYATAALAYEQVLKNIIAKKETISNITTSVAQELIPTMTLENIGKKLGITTIIQLG